MNGYSTSGRHRHADGVVNERQEQILPDVAHRRAAQATRADDAAQVAFDERDAGAFDRDVGAGAHGDADRRLGERRRVVHAVSRHRDDAAGALQVLDDRRAFPAGSTSGANFVDAERDAPPPPP